MQASAAAWGGGRRAERGLAGGQGRGGHFGRESCGRMRRGTQAAQEGAEGGAGDANGAGGALPRRPVTPFAGLTLAQIQDPLTDLCIVLLRCMGSLLDVVTGRC